MTTKEHCWKLHNEGVKHAEIARIVGISRQRVSQICGKYSPCHFVAITESECVYPNWRNFMNENKVTRSELLRRSGIVPTTTAMNCLAHWMRGNRYPIKKTIDKLLSATGLTYEQLFYRGA